MTRKPKVTKASNSNQPIIDKHIHIENCQLSNLDGDRIAAIIALANAAGMNAEAIREIARGVSAGGAIGMNITQAPD